MWPRSFKSIGLARNAAAPRRVAKRCVSGSLCAEVTGALTSIATMLKWRIGDPAGQILQDRNVRGLCNHVTNRH